MAGLVTALGILVPLLVLDIIYLTVRKQYHESFFYSIQKSPLTVRYGAAALVYLILAASLYYGGIRDAKSVYDAALRSSIAGFTLYLFYDATNMATLSQWTWSMVAVDSMWGAVASAIVGAIGYMVMTRSAAKN